MWKNAIRRNSMNKTFFIQDLLDVILLKEIYKIEKSVNHEFFGNKIFLETWTKTETNFLSPICFQIFKFNFIFALEEACNKIWQSSELNINGRAGTVKSKKCRL